MSDVWSAWLVFALLSTLGTVVVGHAKRFPSPIPPAPVSVQAYIGIAAVFTGLAFLLWYAAGAFGDIIWFLTMLLGWCGVLWYIYDRTRRRII